MQALSKVQNNQAMKAFAKLKELNHESPKVEPKATNSVESRIEPVEMSGDSQYEAAPVSSFSQVVDKTPTPEPIKAQEPAQPQFNWQEIVQKQAQSDAKMAELEARAKAAEERANRYQSLVDNGVDDPIALAEAAKLNPQDFMETMANGGKAPVYRSHVKKLESQVGALQAQLDGMIKSTQEEKAQVQRQSQVSQVNQVLSSKPEYAIFKSIPDAANSVMGEMYRLQEVARSRGEAVQNITVDTAALSIKKQLLELGKQWSADENVRKELGWSELANPQDVKATKPNKGITKGMSASGNVSRTTKGYDKNDRLKRAMTLITKS